jgi:hypothetical protein
MPPSETTTQKRSKQQHAFWRSGGVERLCFVIGRVVVEEGVEEATF